MNFKKWVVSIQTAGFNDTHMYVWIQLVKSMLLTETSYYLENQVIGGVNKRDIKLLKGTTTHNFTLQIYPL